MAHDWQVDWIVSHGSTLQELCLGDCSIVFACRMEQDQAHTNFPGLSPITGRKDYFKEVYLRWHQVLERFRQELPRLQHFAMGSGVWDEAFEKRYDLDCAIEDGRYVLFDSGVGTCQWFEGVNRYREGWWFDVNPPDVGFDESKLIQYPQCELEDKEALSLLLKTVRQGKTRTI
jgi:hypothetical protein